MPFFFACFFTPGCSASLPAGFARRWSGTARRLSQRGPNFLAGQRPHLGRQGHKGGPDWTVDDVFVFTLTGEGNAPLPPSNQCKAVVTRDSATTTFGNAVLTFNAAGNYVYTITEDSGSIAGVTYDRTVYKVLVPLKDSGDGSGTLVVDDEHIQYYAADGVTPRDGVTFTNHYAPLSTSVTLGGTKVLNGRDQNAGEFTFELFDANGTPVSTAANQADGRFYFKPLTFEKEGTYTYTVHEKNTDAARVTYDQTVYTVKVTVVDKDGQLTAEIALPDGGLTFTNTYTPEPTPTPKPDHKDKPKPTPAPTSTAQPAAPTQGPRTGDNASLMTWVGILLVCGTALAGLYVYKKRKQK